MPLFLLSALLQPSHALPKGSRVQLQPIYSLNSCVHLRCPARGPRPCKTPAAVANLECSDLKENLERFESRPSPRPVLSTASTLLLFHTPLVLADSAKICQQLLSCPNPETICSFWTQTTTTIPSAIRSVDPVRLIESPGLAFSPAFPITSAPRRHGVRKYQNHQVGGPLLPQVLLRPSSSWPKGVGLRRRLQEASITGLEQLLHHHRFSVYVVATVSSFARC